MSARLTATVLDSRDPVRLGRFYADLLGWTLTVDEPEWVTVRDPGGSGAGLSIQLEPLLERPVWPTRVGHPGMQLHLDIEVDDLASETTRAEDLGASRESVQPQAGVRVMRDPDGHLFCLWTSVSG